MTPLHGIACFYHVGFDARAVSRKTPIFFIYISIYFLRKAARVTVNSCWLTSLTETDGIFSERISVIIRARVVRC